jgi:hypothetical protein
MHEVLLSAGEARRVTRVLTRLRVLRSNARCALRSG